MLMKMTFALAAAIYAGFVIWGAPDGAIEGTAALAETTPAPRIVTVATGDDPQAPVIVTPKAEDDTVTRAAVSDNVVPNASVIAAAAAALDRSERDAARIGVPTRINLRDPAEPAPIAEAAAAEPEDDLLRVTGSRVNMRSGPSTGNRVVDSLPEGTLAEPIGAEQDGWIEIRDVATGREGFMAARFLAPA